MTGTSPPTHDLSELGASTVDSYPRLLYNLPANQTFKTGQLSPEMKTIFKLTQLLVLIGLLLLAFSPSIGRAVSIIGMGPGGFTIDGVGPEFVTNINATL